MDISLRLWKSKVLMGHIHPGTEISGWRDSLIWSIDLHSTQPSGGSYECGS